MIQLKLEFLENTFKKCIVSCSYTDHSVYVCIVLADEKKTNPFMRVEDLTKIQHPQESISEKLVIDMMGNIRRQKDSFRG